MNRALGALTVIASTIGIVIGAAVVKWYVWDVAIGQANESDRSMLFWGLPVLLIGLAALALGGATLTVTAKRIRKPPPETR